jgi:L-lactate dehydrogenase complex protein LldG
MNRDKILNAIGKSVSKDWMEPTVNSVYHKDEDPVRKFRETLIAIGGKVVEIPTYSGISEYMFQHYDARQRIVSVIPLINKKLEPRANTLHVYDNVEVMIMKGHFAVAENGAVWVTDEQMPDLVLPFICQNLAVIINRRDIVPTMQEAYARIGNSEYNFGTFIAGPSKTADIEQSLVLGAHGPKAMTVFLVEYSPD